MTGLDAPDLRIALLAPCYRPELCHGGARFVEDLATGLHARGARPRVITSHPGRPSRSVEDGVPVIRNWRPPDRRLRRRLFEDHLTHAPFSYLSLVRGDDQLAHAVHTIDALAAARWARRTGRPAVFSYLELPDRRHLASRRLRADLMLRAIAGAGAVVAASAAAVRAFDRWLGVPARLIHPGVDTDFFHPAGERASVPTVFCGEDADEPRSRVELLVRAFAQLRRRLPTARLLLARPRSAYTAAALGGALAGAGIELVEIDDDETLRAAYGAAWVAARPSSEGTFDLELVRALACGTAVVAPRLEAVEEIADRSDVGRLFEGDEPEQLAAALEDALEVAQSPETSAACRERALHFSKQRCVDSYLELYRELLAGRRI